jgi:putative transposase
MRGFHSAGGAQRFLSAFSGICPHFRPRRHRLTADAYRSEMGDPIRHLERGHRAYYSRLTTAPCTDPIGQRTRAQMITIAPT